MQLNKESNQIPQFRYKHTCEVPSLFLSNVQFSNNIKTCTRKYHKLEKTSHRRQAY